MVSRRKAVVLLAVAGLFGLPFASYANRFRFENRMDESRSSSGGQYRATDWKFDRADYYMGSDSPMFKDRPSSNPNARSFNEKGSMGSDESE